MKITTSRRRAAFWNGFWGAFGRAQAIMLVVMVGLLPFADTSFATFGSAVGAQVLVAIGAAIFAWSSADESVRAWREQGPS